jgi:hypothetical protein
MRQKQLDGCSHSLGVLAQDCLRECSRNDNATVKDKGQAPSETHYEDPGLTSFV